MLPIMNIKLTDKLLVTILIYEYDFTVYYYIYTLFFFNITDLAILV